MDAETAIPSHSLEMYFVPARLKAPHHPLRPEQRIQEYSQLIVLHTRPAKLLSSESPVKHLAVSTRGQRYCLQSCCHPIIVHNILTNRLCMYVFHRPNLCPQRRWEDVACQQSAHSHGSLLQGQAAARSHWPGIQSDVRYPWRGCQEIYNTRCTKFVILPSLRFQSTVRVLSGVSRALIGQPSRHWRLQACRKAGAVVRQQSRRAS